MATLTCPYATELVTSSILWYVCMSFIFRKYFTRYGNSHVTNNKKHSNIE